MTFVIDHIPPEKLERYAKSDATILITGENGTGKELIAKRLHKLSHRFNNSLIGVNCAAVPAELIESEFFGHKKGAFTGALADKEGYFREAEGGTLFLDEVTEMPEALQSKLLRVLQEREIRPVGGRNEKVNVRIVATTNRVPDEAIKQGKLRLDLFHRLAGVTIETTPLRARPKQDIVSLAECFLAATKHELTTLILPDLIFSQDALQRLQGYDWPGNVRQLQNVVRTAAIDASGPRIESTDLRLNIHEKTVLRLEQQGATKPVYLNGNVVEALQSYVGDLPRIRDMEAALIVNALKRTDGNQVQAAKLLGITRATLRKRVERHGIVRNDEWKTGAPAVNPEAPPLQP